MATMEATREFIASSRTDVQTIPAETVTSEGASEFLTLVAADTRAEFAPGRVNGGRQASFDAVAAWNSVGSID